jgi:hypothetical protein
MWNGGGEAGLDSVHWDLNSILEELNIPSLERGLDIPQRVLDTLQLVQVVVSGSEGLLNGILYILYKIVIAISTYWFQFRDGNL